MAPVAVANADISAKIVVVYGRSRRTNGSASREDRADAGAGECSDAKVMAIFLPCGPRRRADPGSIREQ
jgi:hypothetical protein